MTRTVEPIRGKVARVLNAREVALNKGSDDGVEVGMVFKILSAKGSDIKDPDTGESIGSVDIEKTSVKVTTVQDRVSVASTFRTRRVNVGGGLGILNNALFAPPRYEDRVETLKIKDSAFEELGEEDSFIKTGDQVVQDLEYSRRNEPA